MGGYLITYDEYFSLSTSLLSVMKAHKCIANGCMIFLPHVVDSSARMPSVCEVHVDVIADYTYGFINKFSGLPLACLVDFQFDYAPSVTPIAKTPFRLAS